ncbi:putative G-protein coupled receptor 34 [Bagarius yarrelli]|uniref:Probable G-protein coupled receptor 34 n=1 Tax=Bagarius yarrelli TaxID=175774 RepID=A0A556V9G4_BAGYA|nr:putative G-protein coupled receptor 34 [Bagarius yarrelli]
MMWTEPHCRESRSENRTNRAKEKKERDQETAVENKVQGSARSPKFGANHEKIRVCLSVWFESRAAELMSVSISTVRNVGTMSLGRNSSNDTCEINDGDLPLFLPISYGIICCFGLLSNTFSIFVFFIRRHADSSMAVYMRHLTLADSLLILCLPLRIFYHNKQGPFFLCKMVGIFFYINMYASISFLSLISLHRYLKIVKPVWVFCIQKVLWSRIASCVIWGLLLLGTALFFVSNNQNHPCKKICFHFHNKGLLAGSINLSVIALFGGLFLAFIVFYVKIALKLRTIEVGNADQTARDRRKRLVLKTFLVPVIFTLCFLPYHLVRAPYVLAQMNVIKEVESKQLLHIWNENTLLLSTLNSCLDPVIYYFLSSIYRKTILCAIQGKFKTMYDLNRRRISINRSITEI